MSKMIKNRSKMINKMKKKQKRKKQNDLCLVRFFLFFGAP